MDTLGKIIAFVICIPIVIVGIKALFGGIIALFASMAEDEKTTPSERGVFFVVGAFCLIIAFCIYAFLKFVW